MKYEGDFVQSSKEGLGRYLWADGSQYLGQWRGNKINGLGTYEWKDGRRYYGQFKDNDMHGYGHYFYTDGITYVGMFENDKKRGFGIYTWPDGRKYEGWWHGGKQHGVGSYFDPKKGALKCGLWEHGKRVKWFDEEAVSLINKHRFDVRSHFADPPKSGALFPSEATFQKPSDFDAQIAWIHKELNVLH